MMYSRAKQNEAANRHYHRNKDAITANMRAEYYRKRYGVTTDEYQIMRTERAEKSKVAVRAARIRWKENHPEQQRKIERQSEEKRRAQKLNQFIEDIDRQTVYQMHGGMCGICEQFVPEDDFHVDHVIPLARGGMHGYVNVQPAHPKCNIEKWATV